MAEETTTSGAVEVDVGGQKIMVNAEFAKAFEAERQIRSKEFDDYKLQQEETFKKLQESVVIPDQRQEVTAPQESGTFWDEPEKFLANFRNEILEDTKKARDEGIKLAQNQKTQEDFWNKFYKENKSLDRTSDHLLVQSILQRDTVPLSRIQDEKELIKELGTLTTSYLADIISKTNTTKQIKEDVILEGRGNSPFELPTETKPEKVEGTLSDIVKNRRKTRTSRQQQIRTGN